MTFDEMIEKVLNNENYNTEGLSVDDVITLIEVLRLQYAPTVEMTQTKKDVILRNQNEDKLYEIMADEDGYYFDEYYWEELSPHEVASAYLHPETIKVVDE